MSRTLRTAKQIKKFIYYVGLFLLVPAMLLTSGITASAESRKCSLTLRCVFSVNEGVRVLAGDEYSLAKIADAELEQDITLYTTREEFLGFDRTWLSAPASELNDTAQELSGYCLEKKLFMLSAVTDSSGELKFSDLEPGLYLVSRTKTAAANSDFTTDPLLVFLPETVSGEVIYDAVSTPKFSYVPDKPDGQLPQTGQLLWPSAVFSSLGAFLIILGLLLCRKENRNEK